MKNKKILMLCTTDNMIWQFLIPHINQLIKLNNTVDCVCHKTGFWFDDLRDNYGLNMIDLPFDRNPLAFKNLVTYHKLVKLVKKEKYDVVYCQQPLGGVLGRLIGKKYHIPVIYVAHGFHFFEGCNLRQRLIYKTVEKYCSRYTTALITMNEEDYQSAKSFHSKNVYKINGIGFDENKYEDKINDSFDRDEYRGGLGVAKDEIAVLIVAEFIKRKNYKTMLKTITLCNPNIKFLVCGDGRDRPKIEKAIQKYNIVDRVNLLGYRKDINKIMLSSDIFFLMSIHEGLTLSAIEAMHFGLPLVLSRVRGNKDLVDDFGGYTVDKFNSIDAKNKIDILSDNVALRKSMGEHNKIKSKDYSLNIVLDQMEEIYKTID